MTHGEHVMISNRRALAFGFLANDHLQEVVAFRQKAWVTFLKS